MGEKLRTGSLPAAPTGSSRSTVRLELREMAHLALHLLVEGRHGDVQRDARLARMEAQMAFLIRELVTVSNAVGKLSDTQLPALGAASQTHFEALDEALRAIRAEAHGQTKDLSGVMDAVSERTQAAVAVEHRKTRRLLAKGNEALVMRITKVLGDQLANWGGLLGTGMNEATRRLGDIAPRLESMFPPLERLTAMTAQLLALVQTRFLGSRPPLQQTRVEQLLRIAEGLVPDVAAYRNTESAEREIGIAWASITEGKLPDASFRAQRALALLLAHTIESSAPPQSAGGDLDIDIEPAPLPPSSATSASSPAPAAAPETTTPDPAPAVRTPSPPSAPEIAVPAASSADSSARPSSPVEEVVEELNPDDLVLVGADAGGRPGSLADALNFRPPGASDTGKK